MDGVEYNTATTNTNVMKPGDIVKISRAADAAAVSSLTVADATLTSGNNLIPAAGSYVSYVADGSPMTITFGAPVYTAGLTFGLTGSDSSNTIAQSGTDPNYTVTVNLQAGKTSAVLTTSKTAAQTVTVGGSAVAGGTATAPTYTISGLTNGSTSSFTLTVAETGKNAITYTVNVTVAAS